MEGKEFMGKWFGRKGSQGLGLKLSQWVESQSCCWLYFYKKTDYQIWFCAGHFSETIFKSSNTQQGEVGGGGGGILQVKIDQWVFLGNSGPIIFLSPHTSSWARTGPHKSCMRRLYLRKSPFSSYITQLK